MARTLCLNLKSLKLFFVGDALTVGDGDADAMLASIACAFVSPVVITAESEAPYRSWQTVYIDNVFQNVTNVDSLQGGTALHKQNRISATLDSKGEFLFNFPTTSSQRGCSRGCVERTVQ